MSISVNHYRFRNDDGSESAATWLAAQDTNVVVTIAGNLAFRLRLSYSEDTNAFPNLISWGLQYSKNGGAAVTVVTASACITGNVSGNVSDGSNTTNQLTVDAPNSYVTRAGVVNNANAASSAFTLSALQQTEVEWSLNLIAADVASGDTFDFTLIGRTGSTGTNQFAGNVRLTISSNPPDNSGVGGETLPPLIPPLLSDPRYQRNFLRLPVDSSDKEGVTVPLFGQDDEDFWVTSPAPVPASNFIPLPLGFVIETEDVKVSPPVLPADEDFWRTKPAPVAFTIYQQLPYLLGKDAGELSPGSTPSLTTAFILRKWMSVQQANLWCSCRIDADGPFNLDLLTTADADNGPNYVIRQTPSTPVTVDGTTAGYTQHAQINIPWPAVGQLQIYGAAGLHYYADVRFYYKLRHRRR